MRIVDAEDLSGTSWADLPIRRWAQLGGHTQAFVYMIRRWLTPSFGEQKTEYDYLLVFKTKDGWIAQRENAGFDLTKIDMVFSRIEDAANAALGLIQ